MLLVTWRERLQTSRDVIPSSWEPLVSFKVRLRKEENGKVVIVASVREERKRAVQITSLARYAGEYFMVEQVNT